MADALKIPEVILDQNAGKMCTDSETAKFLGVTYGGPFQVQLGSAIKYGLLERPKQGNVQLTELGKKILKPHNLEDSLQGKREAILKEEVISKIYLHYRGENLPDYNF